MKIVALSLAALTLLGATAASSQTIQIGPGGPSVDFRSPEQRDRDEWRARRAYRADPAETGSVRRCKDVLVSERDAYGNVERHRETRCR